MISLSIWKRFIQDGFLFLDMVHASYDYNEHYTRFIERWGEPCLAMIFRVIQEANDTDRIVALRVLGFLDTPQAVPYLLPFLESSDKQEYWTSAISLGRLRVPQVYPHLKRLASEDFISREWFENSENRWFDLQRRNEVIPLLGQIEDPTIIPLFEDILSRMISFENTYFGTGDLRGELQDWYDTQDAFVYTLGIKQAFNSILKIPVTDQRLHSWMVIISTAFLQKKNRSRLISGLLDNGPLPKAVAQMISTTYAIPLEEAHSYIDFFALWYFERTSMKKSDSEEEDVSYFLDDDEE